MYWYVLEVLDGRDVLPSLRGIVLVCKIDTESFSTMTEISAMALKLYVDMASKSRTESSPA